MTGSLFLDSFRYERYGPGEFNGKTSIGRSFLPTPRRNFWVEVFAMNEEIDPRSDEDFDARIRRLRGGDAASTGVADGGGGSDAQRSGMALAGRIGTEMIAALGVGIGIGLLLDRWLDTKPWLMIVFTLLGSMAGFFSIYRLAKGYQYKAGYGGKSGGWGKDDKSGIDAGKD
jgi:ATP synthase protein I